jgi:hypothetical protein
MIYIRTEASISLKMQFTFTVVKHSIYRVQNMVRHFVILLALINFKG